jgi:hypothetical protein
MKVGTTTQNILHQGGDFIGIDWGYFYATAKHDNSLSSSIAFASQARGQFAKSGYLNGSILTLYRILIELFSQKIIAG